MNVKQKVQLLLDQAGGDPYEALVLAVRERGFVGCLVSAGYVRDSPYLAGGPDAMEEPPSIDDPSTGTETQTSPLSG